MRNYCNKSEGRIVQNEKSCVRSVVRIKRYLLLAEMKRDREREKERERERKRKGEGGTEGET